MFDFLFETVEAAIGLVARAWRSPLRAEVYHLHLITDSDQNPKNFPHYYCKMGVFNTSRDAVYTEKISLIVRDEQVYRIGDGTDRARIDKRQPHLFNLYFPIADIGKALSSAPFTIEIKPTTGRRLRVHGFVPTSEV